MSEDLKPFLMTPEQVTAVLMQFGATLEGFAHQLSSDREALARLVANAAVSIRELAGEIGEGDEDVAAEIITSTARLVSAVRKVVNGSGSRCTIH